MNLSHDVSQSSIWVWVVYIYAYIYMRLSRQGGGMLLSLLVTACIYWYETMKPGTVT